MLTSVKSWFCGSFGPLWGAYIRQFSSDFKNSNCCRKRASLSIWHQNLLFLWNSKFWGFWTPSLEFGAGSGPGQKSWPGRNLGPLENSEARFQQNPEEMANILQNQYIASFSDPNCAERETTLYTLPPGKRLKSRISDIQITQDDIVKAINEIDTYAATSDGDIPASILKECKNLSR